MPPSHIIIHHSLTRDSQTVSWGAIRRYHMGTLGWSDVGYGYGLEQVGDAHEILMGRLKLPGAHCKELEMNRRSVGICVVGNFDEAPPSTAVLDLLRRLVRHLQEQHGIPTASVLGHREVGYLAGYNWEQGEYKSCPGRLFDLVAFRMMLQ